MSVKPYLLVHFTKHILISNLKVQMDLASGYPGGSGLAPISVTVILATFIPQCHIKGHLFLNENIKIKCFAPPDHRLTDQLATINYA